MNNQTPNITPFPTSVDAGMMGVLDGMGQFVNGMKQLYAHSLEEKEYYRQQAEANSIEPTNIVAENKQKELTAIFNVIYKAGYVTGISMKDFMERAANVFGCPGMAKYASALYNVKTTYKYEDIFDNLRQVAQQEKNG